MGRWGFLLHHTILCLLIVPFPIRLASAPYPYLHLPAVSLSCSAKIGSLSNRRHSSFQEGEATLIPLLLKVPSLNSGTVGIRFQHWSWEELW